MRFSTLAIEKYFDDRKSDVDIFTETRLADQSLSQEKIDKINKHREDAFQTIEQLRRINLRRIRSEEPNQAIETLVVFGCGLNNDGTLLILPGIIPKQTDFTKFKTIVGMSGPPERAKYCFAAPIFDQRFQMVANFFALLKDEKHELVCYECKQEFDVCPFHCQKCNFYKGF